MRLRSFALAAVLSAAFLTGGCAGFVFSGHDVADGFIYAKSNTNEEVTENAVGTKQGEACARSILGWITTGDASVATAAQAAGINQISSVDHRFMNIIGVYARYCVLVTGE